LLNKLLLVVVSIFRLIIKAHNHHHKDHFISPEKLDSDASSLDLNFSSLIKLEDDRYPSQKSDLSIIIYHNNY